jgi:hypothetical protein
MRREVHYKAMVVLLPHFVMGRAARCEIRNVSLANWPTPREVRYEARVVSVPHLITDLATRCEIRNVLLATWATPRKVRYEARVVSVPHLITDRAVRCETSSVSLATWATRRGPCGGLRISTVFSGYPQVPYHTRTCLRLCSLCCVVHISCVTSAWCTTWIEHPLTLSPQGPNCNGFTI